MALAEDTLSLSNLNDAPHAYLFVPYNADIEADDDELGAIIRLGEFSDIEELASSDGYLDEYYPKQHIDDANAEGLSPTHSASGSEEKHKGILLACDGRILVMAREKMYLETAYYHQNTTGDNNLVVGGTYTISVKGDIGITSTDGNITVKASSGEVILESGTNKDIIFRAGTDSNSGGTGTIYEYSKGHYKEIAGHEYKVSETENSFTTGTSNNFFFGAKSTINGDADFTLTAGGSATVKPILNLSLTGINVSYTASSTDLKDVYLKVRGIQTSSQALKTTLNNLKSEINAINSEVNEIRDDTVELQVCAEGISSKIGEIDSEIREIKSVM
ncbi:hypothetical protein E1180_07685 [Roseibium denhamense]|uniref:Uncharacterized protein n=1 Tax=Roseibium denhamense TaxID=76305 RepID=A0ABY1NTB7_9HYPH|nr:hypothetical protein [Roseibium denhamense]MTI05395.1 hypothetical protein [Roseibium denhamense]SMP17767.1 hypothetical protein SAMN06265374_1849 [Roseibium denhamense]